MLFVCSFWEVAINSFANKNIKINRKIEKILHYEEKKQGPNLTPWVLQDENPNHKQMVISVNGQMKCIHSVNPFFNLKTMYLF